MLANKFRPLYNMFVMPLGKASANFNISPDFWTLFSLFAAFVGGVFLYFGQFWWGLVFVVVMFIADVLDGATARASGKASKFGMVFDHVIDRYAEFFIIGGLMVGGAVSSLVGIFTASGIVMASYVRAKAESSGGLAECTVGFAGRAEKLILTYGSIVFFGLGYPTWASVMLVLVGIISHITAVQRLLYARKMIPSQ
jgi:CDP-diacylglycerol--glycerol-3-phosphate 3-phosphatidyltransferase/archaetidylinositol phosphate synthase